MIDAGAPDGAHGSLLYRPARWLNLHAGVGSNLISIGVRGGATVYLLPTRVTPSLNVDVGRYQAGDANAAMRRLGVGGDSNDPLLREVGYDYGDLHLGLDFGRERVSFYIHGGLTAMRGRIRNAGDALDPGEDGPTIEVRQDPIATIVAPSARLGFLFYF